MKAKHVYLFLALAGFIVPYYHIYQFIQARGFSLDIFTQHLFINNLTTSFAWDVFIVAAGVLFFIVNDTVRYGTKNIWLPILGTIIIGPAFGLPAYLFLREIRMNNSSS